MCCQFGQHIRQIFVDPEPVCFFRLTAEGTLVHKSDLFREELQLGADGIQLKLQSFDDGNEDMFVHLIELFFGKTGEICHAAPRFISVSIITEMP